MELFGPTKQIYANKQGHQGLICGERKGEGLHQKCSTKDKKEGTGGRIAKFMVAISHGRGVVQSFRYEGNINGELFSQFLRDRFPHIFSKGNNEKGELFLQTEEPSQNCKMSQEDIDKIPYRLFMILPRSSDLNPIENTFRLIGVCLRKDAIMKKIKRETYEQFCNRVTNTVHNFSSDIIDRTISSMPKLIDAVIKMKGLQEHHWGMVIFSGKG